MMNKMMNSMIKGMSVEEREEMMLKMMPIMMKKVDPKICAKNMAVTIGSEITLYSLVDFIIKIINEDELKSSLKGKLEDMKTKMPDMMHMMMPFMRNFMSGMMPKMMSFMMPMMSDMMCGDNDKDCSMMDRMFENPERREKMSQCMRKMMPKCVESIAPSIPKEERMDFALLMIQLFSKEAKRELSEDEKAAFISSATNTIKETTKQKIF